MESHSEAVRAAADLAAAGDAERAGARRFRTAWWFHLATGLVLAGAIIAFSSLPPQYWAGPVVMLVVLGRLLQAAYRRRMHVWGYGVRAGRAVAWNLGIAVVGAAAVLAVLYGRTHDASALLAWLAGGVVFVVAVAFGAAFDAALRRRYGRTGS